LKVIATVSLRQITDQAKGPAVDSKEMPVSPGFAILVGSEYFTVILIFVLGILFWL